MGVVVCHCSLVGVVEYHCSRVGVVEYHCILVGVVGFHCFLLIPEWELNHGYVFYIGFLADKVSIKFLPPQSIFL